MSNHLYKLFLFTSTNILIFGLIEYYRNLKNKGLKTNIDISENLSNLIIITKTELTQINNKIDNLKKEMDKFKNEKKEIVKKIDKTTSTEELSQYNSSKLNYNKLNDDGIIVENEIDLIDDVYDYFPCHNFKKQTVYDILLHNLTK